MYKRIAERRARAVFESIGRHDPDGALVGVADDVHHVFPGDNALGGERHSAAAVRRWFDRVYALFPELTFEVERVSVKGPPWDMWIAVKWTDRGRAADGVAYENRGAHWIRIHRGRGTEVHAYLDSDRVTEHCRRMAAAGIEEAAAPPITG